MLVKDWMNKPAITINWDGGLPEALNLLQQHGIHFLPVMEGARLVGTVTDQDLKIASASGFKSGITPGVDNGIFQTQVNEIMTTDPMTIFYDQTVVEAAELLLIQRIMEMPVIDRAEKVVGTITKSDLFRFILMMSGAGPNSIQIALEMLDRPGCFKEVTDTIRDYGARVSNIMSTRVRAANGYQRVYIRINHIDRPCFARFIEVLKKKVKILYIIDHREKARGEFWGQQAKV